MSMSGNKLNARYSTTANPHQTPTPTPTRRFASWLAAARRRLQAQSKALNTKDMANFFSSITSLDICTQALVKTLIASARSNDWSEDVAIGETVIDNIVNQRIEKTLQVYATCLAPTRHTLASSTFTTFVASLENKLGMKTLPQHLESVFVDVRRRQDLLKKGRATNSLM